MKREAEIPHAGLRAKRRDAAHAKNHAPEPPMDRISPPPASRLTPNTKPGTVLAFDFGAKRIGVAVGDRSIGIAHPLATVEAADRQRRYDAIAALVREWQPSLLVVGLPAHMDGVEHEVSRLARKFARELGARFNLPVELVDERLSSAAAEMSLFEAGVAARKRKPLLDQAAAQQILQGYFDAAARGAVAP